MTLAGLVASMVTAFELLYRLVRDSLTGSSYLLIDEKPVQVMAPHNEAQTATGWLWVDARSGGG
jgi:hypothetical protein